MNFPCCLWQPLVPTEDGIVIEGGQITGATVNSHHDHRIAMSFAVASLRATDIIRIQDCDNVATSFPNFVELAASLGMQIEQFDAENAS